MSQLDNISQPSDIKKLSCEQLKALADELRNRIIEVTAQNGGHIGPNLGVVELTLALHRIFDMRKDKLLMDTSHQGYIHKLLTGRNGEGFSKLRCTEGLSGFLNRAESPYDAYGAGHAGTALSAALGMAVARDLRGSEEHVIALIGDAGFTCGITMEALNNIAHSTKRLIVILNDNKWSISKNVGALAQYLNELITTPFYNRIDKELKSFLSRIPGGDAIICLAERTKRGTKNLMVPSSSLFETYGLRYLGPIDGHNIHELEQYLTFAKNADRPLILHVITQKGKGYSEAIQHPEKFHGTGAFDIATGKPNSRKENFPLSYQDVFAQALIRFAKADSKIIAITGAMPSGTGLDAFANEIPKQFFDVGIAEEHAVVFAAGLATQGFRPVCAIYSTFLQRAYDPIIHDVCLQNLPVLFCMDRAGLSPNDGPTHHGVFDIAYLRPIPHTVIMAPKDEDELVDMIYTGLSCSGPAFIRYPRGVALGVAIKAKPKKLEIGKAEILRPGKDLVLWALGIFVNESLLLAEHLEVEEGLSVGVVNARFAKPLDVDLLLDHARSFPLIVTLEDGVESGGFGTAVLEELQKAHLHTPIERIGWPDKFIPHGSSVADLRALNELSSYDIRQKVLKRYNRIKKERSAPVFQLDNI